MDGSAIITELYYHHALRRKFGCLSLLESLAKENKEFLQRGNFSHFLTGASRLLRRYVRLLQATALGQFTIVTHLAAIGKKSKLDQWVSSDLTDRDRERRAEVCTSLLSYERTNDWLDSVVTGDEKWMLYGPISLAVFTSTPDNVDSTLWVIACLRKAHLAIYQNVTFHLVFPIRQVAEELDALTIIFHDKLSCQSALEFLSQEKSMSNNYARRDVQYPPNLLRNVGRRGARTEFVFVLDADFLPTPGMRREFLQFAERERLFSREMVKHKIAYVVPAFEIQKAVAIPQNKSELISLWDKGMIRPFYSATISSMTQTPTDYHRWRILPKKREISVGYEIQWHHMYEPYVIYRNSAPFFDERFRQFGWDRVSQSTSAIENGEKKQMGKSFHPYDSLIVPPRNAMRRDMEKMLLFYAMNIYEHAHFVPLLPGDY
ncbi:unnamed protein product [Darwinula stevensoni]|uniref:Beta-1,4-glucuronyltransferase 1 n=1 Tax=Darwinula stevensoni TaxID=69355 RepID=A0A7R8XF43_9CRUS|nr:unnamed protein product [Darwinula stevensoni]CAG0894896.1 unnamed protein product [Darwinula stevensoni]